MLKKLYLFLDSEILIDANSLSLAAPFLHLVSFPIVVSRSTYHRYPPGSEIDDDEPKKNHTQA